MPRRLLPLLLLPLLLAGCISAEPGLVAQAVNATLTAAITPTPIVVVVTALGGEVNLPTVTPAASDTPAPASITPPPSATDLPAPTAAATATPPASATPIPTLAPTVSPAPIAHGAVIFEDEFTDPSLWTLADDNVQQTKIENGRFVFTIKAADQYRFVYNSKRRATDFIATLHAATAACSFRDRYGLLFRVVNSSNYYQFDVDCDGSYRVSKVENGSLTPLQNWLDHPAAHAGPGANDLTVRASGKDITVYINGQLLVTLVDKTFAEGGFGLYAGSGLSQKYTVEFERLSVWQLP